MSAWEGLNPPYATIVADPPWDYGKDAARWPLQSHDAGTSRRPIPYSSMSLDAIRQLPVSDLAARDAWLFMWTTNRHLPESWSVLAAWGFAYRQTLVWHKLGGPSQLGGSVAPNHAEFLLVAAKGSPPVLARLDGSVIGASVTRSHSRKPSVFLDAVERVSPGPYVELFARAPRLGWDSWGYGYESERAS